MSFRRNHTSIKSHLKTHAMFLQLNNIFVRPKFNTGRFISKICEIETNSACHISFNTYTVQLYFTAELILDNGKIKSYNYINGINDEP